MKNKSIEILKKTKDRVHMYCINKESVLNRVTTVLEVVGVIGKDISAIDFYNRYLKLNGCAYVGLLDDYEKDWSDPIFDDAISLIGNDS